MNIFILKYSYRLINYCLITVQSKCLPLLLVFNFQLALFITNIAGTMEIEPQSFLVLVISKD